MKPFVITDRLTTRQTESFNRYLKEIATIQLLTVEEEQKIGELAATGNSKAINELVYRNLRFVVTVAKQYVTPQTPLEDLVNEGNLGLILAANRFNPNMGVKFLSYAVWWIRKIIIEFLTKNDRLIRLPSNKVADLAKLNKDINQLEQKYGHTITTQDLIHLLGNENNETISKKMITEYNFLDMLNTYQMDSLDREINNDGGDTTMLDLIPDKNMFNPTDADTITNDRKRILNSIIDKLNPREKYIIIALFGLDDGYPKTLNDVSNKVGISSEMVRQTKEKVLKNLKAKLSKYDLV